MDKIPYVGMRVQVYDLGEEFIGNGTVTKVEPAVVIHNGFKLYKCDHYPTIELDSGEIIEYDECWLKELEETV